MSWIRSGTVNLTNGLPGVTGSGTLWLSTINAGDSFYGPDYRLYEVLSVTSDTSMTLATPYLGATVAGAQYAVFPTQEAIRVAADNLARVLESLQLQTMPEAASTSGTDRLLINQAGISRAITLADLAAIVGGSGGGGGPGIDLPLLPPASLPLSDANILLVNQGGDDFQVSVADLRAQLGGISGTTLEVDSGDELVASGNFTIKPDSPNTPLLTNEAPAGTGGYSLRRMFSASDVNNSPAMAFEARPTFNEVRSDKTGTGAAQELRLRAGSAAQLRLLTSGHLNFRAPTAASLANNEHSLNPAANDRMRVSYRDGTGVVRQRDILLRESTALWFVDDEQYCVFFIGGSGGEDVTAAVSSAAFAADTLKVPLMLPPWKLRITGTFLCNRMIGKPGSSGFIVNSVCTMGGFANQALVNNRNFSQGFNAATADSVYYFGFDFDLTPFNDGMGVLMLGGCKEVTIDKVNIIARRNDGIVSGRPVAANSLIDIYCTNRHVRVTRCQLRNVTGAWGNLGRIGPDGGACMWIRNLRGGTPAQAEEYASFDINVEGNYFEHLTSDEALAVFGVWGIVRDFTIKHNRFVGLPTQGGMHCGTFLSAFPLRFNSGGGAPALDALGATAAVYNGEICHNTFNVSAVMYNVIRVGNGNDALDRLNPCYNIRSHHNHVVWNRSNDGVTGPKAVWVAEGSPGGSGNDPDIVSASIICQNGQFGLAYIADSSGNTSSNDVAINLGGAAIASAFYGWDSIENPLSYGSFYNGVAQSKDLVGGKIECFARPFYNVWSVNGTRYRCAGTGGDVWVYTVEDASGENYSLLNTNGTSFGGFARITNQTEPSTRVNIIGNTASVAQNAAVVNESVKGVVVTARNNTLSGAFSKPMQGATFFNRIFVQPDAPTALGDRDLWLDSDDGHRVYRWSALASSWQTVPINENTAIVQALAPARAGVDNVFDVYYQSTAPTASGVSNLWFDAGDRYKLYEDTGTWTPTTTPLGLAIVRVSGAPFIYGSGNSWGAIFD